MREEVILAIGDPLSLCVVHFLDSYRVPGELCGEHNVISGVESRRGAEAGVLGLHLQEFVSRDDYGRLPAHDQHLPELAGTRKGIDLEFESS